MTQMNMIHDGELTTVTGGVGMKIGLGEGGGKNGNLGRANGRKDSPDTPESGSGSGTDVEVDNPTDGTEDQSSGLG